MSTQTDTGTAGTRLAPYLPRLVPDWLSTAPDSRYRAVDGTMVFVDVSGFTALSERLARQGRAGAEELTDILDGVFVRLLTIAWHLGGSLVKFGGDALLLLFTDPGHAMRATAAAFDMRAELEVVGRIQAAGEEITLRMSVGVHTGRFDFFLVGTSHRELILTGPAATRTEHMEGTADAGQILVSADTAAAVGPEVLGGTLGEGWLLEGRPDVAAGTVEPVEGSPLGLEVCVPVGLRRRLLSGVRTSEHRMVTIGFLHFLGVDELLRDDGPDTTADALEAVVAAVQQHADRYDVTFLSSDIYGDGGKLILAAGAPDASADATDEERMLRTMRGIFDTELPLAVRAGINRGHVYAGDVGTSMRRTYTVMGDAVNLAARLMSAAEPGQILTSGVVLERSRTEFATTPLPPFHVKGKARPIQAFAVGDVIGWRKARRGAQLPLIGRDAELGRLLTAADAARDHRGQVVQLVGEAGIGKTRLVEEIRDRARDMRQYLIACEQYERSTPFWPFRLLLRRLLDLPLDAAPGEAGIRLEQYVRDTDPDLLPWLPLLAIPVNGEVDPTPEVDQLDPAFRGPQLERATTQLLEHLVPDPTLIIVEDIYWLDEASHGLLRSLSRTAATQPWLWLLTNRDVDRAVMPDEDADHVQVIRLAPLQPDEMEALAAAASELAPRPVHELTAVAERAGGSPLFLIELVASGRGADLPDTIEAAITARIDTVDPTDRTLLRCAAVLGASFPLRLAEETLAPWAPVIDDVAVWSRLDEFVVRESHDRARFRHALIHDVAYEGLPFGLRREIHGQVATVLEHDTPDPDEIAELLALHFLCAERYDQGFRYSRTAADRALEKAATADAAKFYRQALDASRHVDVSDAEVAELAETLGDVAALAGLYEEGSRAYRTARRLDRDSPVRVATLLRKEGRIRDRAGRYDHARRLYRTGLAIVRENADLDGMDRVRAELEVMCAGVLAIEGRYRPCIWWAKRAAETAAELGDRKILANAYYLLDAAYTDLGDPASADYRELALPIYEELGDLVGQGNVLSNLGANAYYEGDWEAAVVLYGRGRTAYEKAGDLVQAAREESNLAEVLCQQGHLEQAQQGFRMSLRVFLGAGFRAGVAWVTGYLGLIAARLGEFEEGQRLLAEARDLCKKIGAENMVMEATMNLAEVSILKGDHRTARSILVPVLAAAREKEGLGFLQAGLQRLHGYALLQARDVDGASREFEESLALAEAAGASYEVALALEAQERAAGVIGRTLDGSEARSTRIFEELGVVRTPAIPLPSSDELGQPLAQSPSRG